MSRDERIEPSSNYTVKYLKIRFRVWLNVIFVYLVVQVYLILTSNTYKCKRSFL